MTLNHRYLIKGFVALMLLSSIVYLQTLDVVSRASDAVESDLQKRECVQLGRNNTNSSQKPNCSLIATGDFVESCRWSQLHTPMKSDSAMAKTFDNCRKFKTARGYPSQANSLEESQFPIAFSISMHQSVEQTERLLRLIYWPQNLYCIHVDKKASSDTHKAIKALASCFPNVLVIEPEYVYWAGFGVLNVVLRCMDMSIQADESWKYFINLAAQDFPLKTNWELVKILKIFDGANDVEMRNELLFSRYWFSHQQTFDKSGIPIGHRVDFQHSKLPVPHQLKIYKGNLAASLSRPFVLYLMKHSTAGNLTEWLKDTDTADEHLWSTLNHNPNAKAPGGYPGNCHPSGVVKKFVSRYARWQQDKYGCHGRYIRDVCVFGVRDLPELLNRPELFVNKLHLNYQSTAFHCMEELFLDRVKANHTHLDLNYYRNLDVVQYHKFMRLYKAFGKRLAPNECPPYMAKLINGTSNFDADIKQYISGGINSIVGIGQS